MKTDDQLKQRDAVSDTPRTDTVAFGTNNESLNRLFWIRELPRYVAPADFARQLERELAAATAERDEARAICKLSDGMAIHAITCIHHTDADRASLPTHGNCPVCAARLLAASQQEARRLREALDAIMESAKVAYCATTDPMMTDALVGIGKRCKDAIEND